MAFKMSGFSAFTKTDDKRRLKEAKKDLANLRLDRLNPKNIGNKKVQANLKSAIEKIKQDINRFKSNIEADKDFLKSQREEPVKRSDLDKKGKEIYDKLHKNK